MHIIRSQFQTSLKANFILFTVQNINHAEIQIIYHIMNLYPPTKTVLAKDNNIERKQVK